MTDVTPVPVASESIGQKVDAELAVVKARIAVIEAAAKTDWVKTKAYVVANVPHLVTWAGMAYGAVKLGVLKIL